MNWISELSARIQREYPPMRLQQCVPLAEHTSFRIGGPAALMASPTTPEELAALCTAAAALRVRTVILGAGTNVLAPDEGLDALVILTKPGLSAIVMENGILRAGCGTTLELSGLSVRPAADGADLLICTGRCDRRLRPLSCRIYPLYPQIGADGRVRARYDPRAWAQCPLSREQAHVRLQPAFVRAVRRVGRLLQNDPDTAPALRAQSDELTALSALLPQSGRPPIARRSPIG